MLICAFSSKLQPTKLYLEPENTETKEISETSTGKTGNATAKESKSEFVHQKDGKEERRQSASRKGRIPIPSKARDSTITKQQKSMATSAAKGASASATQENSSSSRGK